MLAADKSLSSCLCPGVLLEADSAGVKQVQDAIIQEAARPFAEHESTLPESTGQDVLMHQLAVDQGTGLSAFACWLQQYRCCARASYGPFGHESACGQCNSCQLQSGLYGQSLSIIGFSCFPLSSLLLAPCTFSDLAFTLCPNPDSGYAGHVMEDWHGSRALRWLVRQSASDEASGEAARSFSHALWEKVVEPHAEFWLQSQHAQKVCL